MLAPAPQELLLLSIDGLSVELHRGNCAGTPYDLIALRVYFVLVCVRVER